MYTYIGTLLVQSLKNLNISRVIFKFKREFKLHFRENNDWIWGVQLKSIISHNFTNLIRH